MNNLVKALILIILILSVLNLFLAFRKPVFEVDFTNIKQHSEYDFQGYTINDSFSHSERLHWTHMPLSYIIYNCSDYQTRRILRALEAIENETNKSVLFRNNTDNETDINIVCNKDYKPSEESKGYMTIGESGYWTYKDFPNIIAKAEINFYGISENTYSGGCIAYPDAEVHELLHAFGYGHTEDRWSIMYPSSVECIRSIDDDITEDLIETYKRN